jgi:hypothetical protein
VIVENADETEEIVNAIKEAFRRQEQQKKEGGRSLARYENHEIEISPVSKVQTRPNPHSVGIGSP